MGCFSPDVVNKKLADVYVVYNKSILTNDNTWNFYNSFMEMHQSEKALWSTSRCIKVKSFFKRPLLILVSFLFFLYFEIDVGCSTLTNNGLLMTSLCTKGGKNITFKGPLLPHSKLVRLIYLGKVLSGVSCLCFIL